MIVRTEKGAFEVPKGGWPRHVANKKQRCENCLFYNGAGCGWALDRDNIPAWVSRLRRVAKADGADCRAFARADKDLKERNRYLDESELPS